MRTERDVREALELGVARVLVGTLAAQRPELVGALAAETARVAVAADVRNGTVRAAGWREDTGTDAVPFVQRLTTQGVRDVLATAIERDGTGAGPDTALLARLRTHVPGLLIAAGGIGSVADVRAAVAAGADGVVIGRALYDGSMTFRDASASLRSSPIDKPS
jgi:phosphoribosylformimino-5-aminoimidazole carboxamide ribotide isomerase